MPVRMTRWSAPLLLVAAGACAHVRTAPTPSPATRARMEQVLEGLRPPVAVAGEPAVRWSLAERMRAHHVPGVSIAVIDSGRLVWARGFGVKEAGGTDSVTPETMFQAGSISKPTFAIGVMRLVQDGTLDLDQDVNARLTSWKVPENAFTAQANVTLRRILSHSAGLTVHGFPGYAAGAPIPTVPQILDGTPPANTAPVRVDTVPGAISRYSGGGLTIAMLLVTDVTHEPLPRFMQQMVLGPAGMTHSTYRQPLPASLAAQAASAHTSTGEVIPGKYHTYPEMSAAGLWTTPSDLAKLAIELQRTAAGRSHRLIRPATLREMLTVQKAPFGIGYVLNGSGPDFEFSHGGSNEGFNADFTVFPARGQGAVIMTNGDDGGALIGEILPSIAEAFGWAHHRAQVKAVHPTDPAVLADIAGRYRLSLGGPEPIVDTVTVSDGKLFMAAGGAIDRVELLAESDSTFFTRDVGYPVVFGRDSTGHVARVTLFGDAVGTKIR